eukprot:GHRR01025801.1.p1 GENE.GHRR01025801.1~~GHRR01025801.1.p1  ORF type:complete len:128 (+),score=31.93 GHRR01025801.1:378-761(+)
MYTLQPPQLLLMLSACWLCTVSALAADSWRCPQLPQSGAIGSVVKDQHGHFAYQSGVQPGAVAHGVYVDSADTISNFGKLRISTSASFSDKDQMAAAGWLEGYLTAGVCTLVHHISHMQNPRSWCAQ